MTRQNIDDWSPFDIAGGQSNLLSVLENRQRHIRGIVTEIFCYRLDHSLAEGTVSRLNSKLEQS